MHADAENDARNEAGDEEERFGEPGADRMPTSDEEAAAERAAAGVDVGQVGEHYGEMAERGAHVQGEGDVDGLD